MKYLCKDLRRFCGKPRQDVVTYIYIRKLVTFSKYTFRKVPQK